MSEEKNKATSAEEKKEELNLEDLEKVQGGSIRDVKYTQTKPMSKDTQEKI